MTWAFAPLPRHRFTAVIIDPPWRFAAGTKGRPQHYGRMKFDDILALPVRQLLHPRGGRVFLWITAPLADRVPAIADAWGLSYSSMITWVKLNPLADPDSARRADLARGMGLEVAGNCEHVAILKAGRPHRIVGNPFPSPIISPRREHSRKPDDLAAAIEARIPGPWCELFARGSRPGWEVWGNETAKFGGRAA
jgi:N6-adenosine-specific RNA methylase IME4